jgi:molybdenum cofactor cytidylyltransferase
MNGQPKQLLEFRGKTLLRRAAETALNTNCETVVVLGANAENFTKEIADLSPPLRVVVNENWAAGMGVSIKTGLSVLANENLDAVVVMLCDQPFVTAETIRRLIEKFEQTGAPVVACLYNNTTGVPALFARKMFAELSNLEGDAGAKAIIKKHHADVAQTPAPEAAFDVNTEADFLKLSLIKI